METTQRTKVFFIERMTRRCHPNDPQVFAQVSPRYRPSDNTKCVTQTIPGETLGITREPLSYGKELVLDVLEEHKTHGFTQRVGPSVSMCVEKVSTSPKGASRSMHDARVVRQILPTKLGFNHTLGVQSAKVIRALSQCHPS